VEQTGLIGVFLGGALPWLEAVIVIPLGIVAGLDPVAVVVAGFTGNLLTVAAAAYGGERIRSWWRARRHRAPEGTSRRSTRAEKVFTRWGLPGVAVLGPLAGTQMCAAIAVGLGASASRTTLWVGAGTLVWCVAAAVLTVTGTSFLGVGA
jgi:membrane protein DedA with SNARE-associated domain